MSSVFHYTDVNGLLGILRSETLFATDYRYLNDFTEGSVIRDLITPILEAEIAQLTPKLIEKKWLKEDYLRAHGGLAHELQAGAMYRSIARTISNVSPVFVLSFCKHEEGSEEYANGLLSQWRGYAESGGFAIEFDEQGLDTDLRKELAQYAIAGFKSESVLYRDYEREFDPEVYRGVAGELIRVVFDHHGIDTTEVTGQKDIDEVVLKFLQVAPFLKHWGFHEECEYRIVVPCIRRSRVPPEETREPKRIFFRCRGSIIVPYVELFSPKLPIKSIIVGPHPDQDKQAEAVRMVLEVEEIDAPVGLSSIPYRR